MRAKNKVSKVSKVEGTVAEIVLNGTPFSFTEERRKAILGETAKNGSPIKKSAAESGIYEVVTSDKGTSRVTRAIFALSPKTPEGLVSPEDYSATISEAIRGPLSRFVRLSDLATVKEDGTKKPYSNGENTLRRIRSEITRGLYTAFRFEGSPALLAEAFKDGKIPKGIPA